MGNLSGVSAPALDASESSELSADGSEERFWNESPRYSVDPLCSIVPPAPRPEPTRLRRLGATLLFFAVFCGTTALLGFEPVSAVRAGALPAVHQ
jgi:hypothetical protein